MGGLDFRSGIIHYYLFQKKLSNYLNKRRYEADEYKSNEGFLIHPDWIGTWRKIINYEEIKSYLDGIDLNENNMDSQKGQITQYLVNSVSDNEISYISQLVKTNYFVITQENIFNESFLMNMMPNDVFESLQIHERNQKIKIKYLFKQIMVIFAFEDLDVIKIIITDTNPFNNNEKNVNLSLKFVNPDMFSNLLKFFEKNDSQEILTFFVTNDILVNPMVTIRDSKNNETLYILVNEDLNQNNQYENQIIFNSNNDLNYNNDFNSNNAFNSTNNYKDYNTSKKTIKKPEQINFNLIQRPSYRGLDNVGATCYMNATLQCLANIKPLTDYFLNPKKYYEIFNSKSECPLTIDYCQVLLGLYCDNSNTGSYAPQQFKNTIGDMNPLFQGVQANDSKDLIIFLLEVLNSELSKLHNKKLNITKKENETGKFQMIDPSDQNAVLKEFLKDFKYSHATIIGEQLYGFQRNVFTCQKCGGISNNFNLFNILIFSLEATANLFNINNNYGGVPIITFDQCFQFLCKEENFQETYCQKCKKTGNSIYKENIFLLPNYLIIILNRGKGNIFNCKVDIPEVFDSSQYEENMKNKKYELIGVVSHFGSYGMGGHFIAFCKHSMDGKWRCYNDSTVVESQNDYLQKGTPYILFYKNMNIINNQINNNNNQMNNINQFNNNNQMNNINQFNNNNNQFNNSNQFYNNNQFNNNQINNNNQFNNNQINNNNQFNNSNQFNSNQYDNNSSNASNSQNRNSLYDNYGSNNMNYNIQQQQQQQQQNNNQNINQSINMNFFNNMQQGYNNMGNNFQGNMNLNNNNFQNNNNMFNMGMNNGGY